MRQGVIFFVVNEEVVNTSKCYLILHSVDWKVKCLSKKITSNFAVQMCLICYGQRLRYIHILLVFGIQRFQTAYINETVRNINLFLYRKFQVGLSSNSFQRFMAGVCKLDDVSYHVCPFIVDELH